MQVQPRLTSPQGKGWQSERGIGNTPEKIPSPTHAIQLTMGLRKAQEQTGEKAQTGNQEGARRRQGDDRPPRAGPGRAGGTTGWATRRGPVGPGEARPCAGGGSPEATRRRRSRRAVLAPDKPQCIPFTSRPCAVRSPSNGSLVDRISMPRWRRMLGSVGPPARFAARLPPAAACASHLASPSLSPPSRRWAPSTLLVR